MSLKKLEYVTRMLNKYGINLSSIKTSFNLLFATRKNITITLKRYAFPIYIRKRGSDIEVFHEVLVRFGYKFNTKLNFKPQVIIDCGANIGLASVYFKSLFPDSQIIAIEPEINNYNMMVDNLKCYNEVFCMNVGVWNRKANIIVDNSDTSDYGFSFHEVADETEGSVKALSIKDIMNEYSIDYIDILKIDIEGAEKELFGIDYDVWLSRTRLLIIELHDRMREGCSKTFFDALSKYNYSTEIRGENIFVFFK